MDDQDARPEFSREPTIEDLVRLCERLNQANASYVVIGGFAIILNGYVRTTGDIDLLIDSSTDNVQRVKDALLYLPDRAVLQIEADEVAKYSVVRVADEIIVDLMQRACEVTYDNSKDFIQVKEIEGVQIPFLKPEALLRTKLTIRPKDYDDRMFLEHLLSERKAATTPEQLNEKTNLLRSFWASLKSYWTRER